MFKFIKRKIIEGIIKDFIEDLPKYKEQALGVLEAHKDELLCAVKNAIQKAVREFIEKKLGIKFY